MHSNRTLEQQAARNAGKTRRPRNPLTDEQKAEAVARVANGDTVAQIARDFDCPHNTVKRHVRKATA